MSAGVFGGNASQLNLIQATLSPASVAANTTAEQTFTIPGLTTRMQVLSVQKPTAQAGLGIVGMRVAGANSIGITFSNNTASPIVPTASEAYKIALALAESQIPFPTKIQY